MMRLSVILLTCLAVAAHGYAQELHLPEGVLLEAGPPTLYKQAAYIELGNFRDLDENRLRVGYRYYLQGVVDDDDPIVLQPFIQKASYLEAMFQDGPADWSLFELDGTFLIPNTGILATAELGYGEAAKNIGLSFFTPGAVVYLGREDMAIETAIVLGDVDGDAYSVFDLGFRIVTAVGTLPGSFEGYVGYRSFTTDVAGVDDDSGVVLDANYHLSKEVFVGLSFVTGDRDKFSVIGGYASSMGLDAVLEIGDDQSELRGGPCGEFLRFKVGYRF
jgi:hypothetical protein